LLESQTLFHNIDIVKDLNTITSIGACLISRLCIIYLLNIILKWTAQAMEGRGVLTVKKLPRLRTKKRLSSKYPIQGQEYLKKIFPTFLNRFLPQKKKAKEPVWD